MIQKVIKDEKTGITRRICTDIRIAAQSYSNIAGVLAGFAFTVIVLIVQINDASGISADIKTLRNLATVGFLATFFGCVLSAFAFPLIAAEEALTRRANHMALFAGLGFSVAIGLLFWSLAILLKTFLLNEVADVAYQIFPLFMMIHPAYVGASILDNIYIFEIRRPNLKEYFYVLAPSYLLLFSVFLLKLLNSSFTNIKLSQSFFNLVIWFSISAIILNNILTVILCASDEEYKLPLKFSGLWLVIQSFIICLLIISL